MADNLSALGEHIAASLGPLISGQAISFGELTVHANAADVNTVLTFLRDDPECRFVCFIDICGADYPAREKRFDVVYHLLSPYKNQRIRVKVQADEDTQVPSAIPVFPAANWYERETFDLFGIHFRNHPNLTRLLMPEGYVGYPLRRDFPIHGHKYSYKDE